LKGRKNMSLATGEHLNVGEKKLMYIKNCF